MIRRRILVAVVLAALFALGWWSGREGGRGELYANLDRFVEVLHRVDENYVEPIDPQRVMRGAITGLLQTLDPYSQYLDSREFGSLQEVTRGSFSGVGIEVGIRDHYPTVIAPIEGGPAWESGIQTGDAIVKVDGRSTADFTLEQLAKALRGPTGTRVTVTISRDGEPEDRDVELTRREIVIASVPYAFVTDDGVGYLRIARFSEDTDRRLRDALTRLRTQGATSLVIDLRQNPGGLLEQAVDVAGHFVPRGSEIVSTRGRNPALNRRYASHDVTPETGWPMAVLVDEGSASASEVVAGALQDLDRALIVGHTSFGKGSVQNVFPLASSGAAVKLTTALYYTPSGRSIHRRATPGATTDPLADDEGDGDEPPPDSALARPANGDTTARPAFRTSAGRIVLGGGGITPDASIAADTLGPIAGEFERRGLGLRFARRWETAHAGPGTSLPDAPALWPELVTFLVRESHHSADSLALERPNLTALARREIARRHGGDAGAARAALEQDAAFQRAASVLRRSHAAAQVFAIANTLAPMAVAPAPAAEAPATRTRPQSRRWPASHRAPVHRH